MTTLAPTSKHAPRRPCFAVFCGSRRIRNALFEHLAEPVQVVEYRSADTVELAVVMTGRATRFPLANFEGTWAEIIVTEEQI